MAEARQELLKLLNGMGESAQFVASGRLPPVLPGLAVEGLGTVGVPVSTADAERLIARAAQAPYGRGEETIVDTNVRRVWQIEPTALSFRNKGWDAHVAEIVAAVRTDFGIEDAVSAELYKLLIYEKGSFFAPHRDTEKTPGMFASLVVGLPSRHEGGTLMVRHDGQTRTVDFGGEEGEFQTQYAAFYADCEHEIAPVTSGHRVCLVYNLALTEQRQPSAPRSSVVVEPAAEHLRTIFADAALDKIAIPFKHQYTESGLDPRQLKGSDRAWLDVLARAAEANDYRCFVALLTDHQCGSVDPSSYGYRPSRSYGRYRDDDDNGDVSNAEIDEVIERELGLDHWFSPCGEPRPLGRIHLDDEEILANEDDRDDWSCQKEIHEATGNAGATMELWYRTGVVVLWPADRTLRILAGEGQASALPELERMAAEAQTPAAVTACQEFASHLMAHWAPHQRIAGDKGTASGRMLKVLKQIGTAELAEHFLRDILPKDFDGSEGDVLVRLGERFGWDSLTPALREFLVRKNPKDYHSKLEHIVALFEGLCRHPPALTEGRHAACTAMADELLKTIESWDREKDQWRDAERNGVVDGAVRYFAEAGADEWMDRFLTHVLADTKHYDIRAVLIPAVKAVFGWLPQVPAAQPAAARLLAACLAELGAATARPIVPPSDWSRPASLQCKCEDCQALSRFLHDTVQQVGRFPLRKDRRQHLHQQIDRHHCDCTHITDPKGSPQTLVVTKNQASYERRVQQFESDKALLAELESFAVAEKRNSRKSALGRKKKG